MPHEPLSMERALAKAHDRRALFHTFYLAAPSVEEFWARMPETEQAIRRIMIARYGRP